MNSASDNKVNLKAGKNVLKRFSVNINEEMPQNNEGCTCLKEK